MSPESTVHTSSDPSFERTRNDVHDNVHISAWEGVLDSESEPSAGEDAAAANEGAPVEEECRQIENYQINREDVIAREAKLTVKGLHTIELATMVDEMQDDILTTSSHNPLRWIRAVVYNLIEKVMLNLLRKEVIR